MTDSDPSDLPEQFQDDALIDDLEALKSVADAQLIGELQELVEEWREIADSAPHPMCSENLKGNCADELQEVIEQYE